MRTTDFGADFTWGVASAAFQVEGAWDRDGKAPSVWDEACRRGRVRGGTDCRDGIDAFDRLDEDLDLIAALGVGANRFSVSWPRVFGDGRGPWNAAGGAYYDRLIDGCLERGLEPWLTVHHWDLPLALQQEGGWARRGIVEDFAGFAEEVGRRYGDRVRHWMVFNEPLSVVGHIAGGVHARRLGPHPLEALASMHHMNLAIAEAGRRLRDVLPSGAQVGTTNVFTLASPFHTDDGRLRRAQRAAEAFAVDGFLDPLAGRGYPFDDSPFLRPMRRFVRDGDEAAMAFDVDFMGVQYYGPLPMRRVPLLGGLPTAWERTSEARVRSSVGIPVDARGLTELLRRYRHHPACPRFVITESGFGMNDRVDGDGRIHDDLRIWVARTHLQAVREAQRDGVAVDGFFQWSYADNIEWVLGRSARFGLVHVDYDDDMRRRPKDSYLWFRRFLTEGTAPDVAAAGAADRTD